MKRKNLPKLLMIAGVVLALGVVLIGLPSAVDARGPRPQDDVCIQQTFLGTAFISSPFLA